VRVFKKSITRRENLKWIIGGAATLTVGSSILIKIISDIGTPSIPRILPDWINRSTGDTALPIPRSWYRDFDQVSINSNPLDRATIESIPMTDIDCKKYCKSNPAFPIKKIKFGMSMPNVFKKLEMDFNAKPGQLIATANDWYVVVPAEPENTFFSACKNNIPKELWKGKGYEQAINAKLTPYGVFIPYGNEASLAWKDVVDLKDIHISEEEVLPGNYFIGPDKKIIIPEDKDVSMSLDTLLLTLVMPDKTLNKIPYSSLQKIAEQNTIRYRNKDIPSINLNALIKSFNLNPKEHALILYANKYVASIPPWRQQNLRIVFDNYYANKYGVSTKLLGGNFLNKAAQVGGFYKIEVKPMNKYNY